MKPLLAALAWLGLTTAAFAQGYLNPPVYATGTIFAVTGVTGSTTTPIKNAYAPNNLNIYNRTAMSGTWHIVMPFPAFDGEIINIGCPGGNIAVVSVEAVAGSGDLIGSGGPTTCTASVNALYMYQFQLETNTWKFITATGGGGGSGCDDCILVESGVSSKVSAFSLTPQPLGPNGLVTGIWTDPDTGIPANFNFDQTAIFSTQNAIDGSATSITGIGGNGAGTANDTVGGSFNFIAGSSSGQAGGTNVLTGGVGNGVASGGGSALVGGVALGTGDGGYVLLQGGAATDFTSGTGGGVSILTGDGFHGGPVIIATPDTGFNGGTAHTGAVTVSTGTSALEASSGLISIITGGANGEGNSSGAITIRTGNGTTDQFGDSEIPATIGAINITGGNNPGHTTTPFGAGPAGNVNINGGDGGDFDSPGSGHGTGGNISLTSGFGVGTGWHAGNVIITIGATTDSAAIGNLIIHNIPTSSAGLPSGAVWSNSNVLTIVP